MNKAIFLIIVMIVSALAFIFPYMSYVIDKQNAQLSSLDTEIHAMENNISILESEWSYLSRPERLSALASKYLDMQTPEAVQIATFDSLDSQRADKGFKKIQASYRELVVRR